MSTPEQQWDIVSGVGMTALAVAAGRAMESGRPEPLMSDPYAAHLVAEAAPTVRVPVTVAELGPEQAADGLWSMVFEYVGIRSRAFDDYLDGAVADGITQVVILASGLDSRPFRLAWPAGVTCYEIDQPAVLDFKLNTLREHGADTRCQHRPVRADLREDWAAALEQAGFDRDLPTVWLAEGLLPYLPAEAEDQLFAEIDRLSCSGSRLAVEQVHDVPDLTSNPVLEGSDEALGVDVGALLHYDVRKPSDARLSDLGWKTHNMSAEDTATGYGRELLHSTELTRYIVHTFARCG